MAQKTAKLIQTQIRNWNRDMLMLMPVPVPMRTHFSPSAYRSIDRNKIPEIIENSSKSKRLDRIARRVSPVYSITNYVNYSNNKTDRNGRNIEAAAQMSIEPHIFRWESDA